MTAALVTSLAILAAVQPPEHYAVHQRVKTTHGVLEILEDARLTPKLEAELWNGCSQPLAALDPHDPAAKTFIGRPVLPARLRQRDRGGHITQDLLLEQQAPVARINPHPLGPPNDPIIVVETSDATCFGSYSGWTEWFFRFEQNRPVPVMATVTGGHPEQVSLFRSLKSGWRFVRNKPHSIEIEQLLCRPDETHATRDNLPFLLTYITYRFDGQRWWEAERHETGSWESERPFPARSEFPTAGP